MENKGCLQLVPNNSFYNENQIELLEKKGKFLFWSRVFAKRCRKGNLTNIIPQLWKPHR